MTGRARSSWHLVSRLLLPVLWHGLVTVAGVVAVLGWRVSHRLLLLPRASHGLHRLHWHGVGHMRRAGLLRTALRVAVELLVGRSLGSNPGALGVVCGRRALWLERPSTRMMRCA